MQAQSHLPALTTKPQILLLVIVRAFTRIILELTLALAVLMSVAYAVYLWVERYWSGAIVFTVFAVLSVLAYPGMRRRIPLSKQLLLFVLAIAKAHPSVYVIALIGSVLVTLYSIFWSISVVAIYQKWDPNAEGSGTSGGNASSGALIGLMVFAVFNLYVRPLDWYSGVTRGTPLPRKAAPTDALPSTIPPFRPVAAPNPPSSIFAVHEPVHHEPLPHDGSRHLRRLVRHFLSPSARVWQPDSSLCSYYGGADAKRISWGAFRRASTYSCVANPPHPLADLLRCLWTLC